jgi:hypothetical protein
MTATKSLRDQILGRLSENQINEKLHLKKGGQKTASSNISKATKDFATSDAPQFRGKSKAKRHQMAIAAGLSAARGESVLKVGDKAIYEHKPVKIQSINESMAIVKFSNRRDPIIVRLSDIEPIVEAEQLNEGFIGIAPITPTYRDPADYGFVKFEPLNARDIGLFEDDEEEAEEEEADNGSNVDHDGHRGKTEVDDLPTPSDTIATAYTDEEPPKEQGSPLIIEPGAEESKLWEPPQWDGYDYPADAPEIPTADFLGSEMGNSRAPHFNASEHQPGDGQEDRSDEDDDGDKEEVDEGSITDRSRDSGEESKELSKMRKDLEYVNEYDRSREDDEDAPPWAKKSKDRNPEKDRRDERSRRAKEKSAWIDEAYFMEMGDMLDGPDTDQEPTSDTTITTSLGAMASILVTVCKRQPDRVTLRAMVEALAEVSKGKTIEMNDLQAVANHLNGEECEEMRNREEGLPDHEGIESSNNGGESENEHEEDTDHEDHEDHDDHESWPGDGDKTDSGKSKLLDGGMQESLYYNSDDVMAGTELSEEEELRIVKRRSGLRYW